MATAALPGPRTLVLSLLGAVLLAAAGTSGYLLWHHENAVYGDANAELGNCPATETVNCEAVNSSEYSELFGVPLAGWGLATYLFLFGVVAVARRRPALLAEVFAVGLLMTLFSAYLFYVSKVKVGFICLWCVRLYVVNLATPVLAWAASRRTPRELLGEVLAALSRPREVAPLAAWFLAAVLVTVAAQRGYRASLVRLAKKEAATPAPPPVAEQAAPIDATGLLKVSWGQNGTTTSPFDLKALRGKPVALFFWAPGVRISMLELIDTAAYFRREAPQIPFFAVAGKREGQRLDSMYETFKLLGIPDDVPLLIDPDFVTAGVLGIPDVPSLALFNAKGTPVVTQVKSMTHVLGASPAGPVTAANLVRALADGHPIEALPRPRPYYPGTELYGACAPSFRLPQFGSGKDFQFSGKSASGKPTLVMFWSPTCKHCQKEIPPLVAHYKAHPGQYDVIGITTVKKDKEGGPSHRELTAQYIESVGIPWPILEDADASVGERFNVISTPTTYLIAANGEVIDAWYFVHPNLDEALDKDLVRLKAVTGECKVRPEPKPHVDFNVTAPDGKEVAVSSLADKPTLVHLWATWCQPCLKELPSFINFKKRLGRDANVVFVSVEDAESGPTIEKFKKDHAFAFDSYRAPHGGLAGQIELGYAVPRTFLLGPGAEVLDVRYGEQQWDDPAFERQVRARMQLPPVSAAR